MPMYREVSVWERTEGTGLVCYRCLELLPQGGFCVQSADFYQQADDFCKRDKGFARQFIELLIEDSPEARTKVFPTLQEAIEDHKREFEGNGAGNP
jgi:hypothetical protein